MRKRNTVVVIISLFMGALFVGATLPSVLAGSISQDHRVTDIDDDSCSLCRSNLAQTGDTPNCKSCREAVAFAVDYMKDYVKDNMDNNYFLWRVDITILIVQGLVKGFKDSGYKLEVDENELRANIEYWVNRTCGSQKFTITIFLAKLSAITIGITGYLLTLCIDNDADNSHTKTRQIRNISWIKSKSILWVILKHLLGLFY